MSLFLKDFFEHKVNFFLPNEIFDHLGFHLHFLLQERFTFKFKHYYRQSIVKLEFFINELFECCLSVNCEQEQIDEENDLFQLQAMQLYQLNRKYFVN